MRRQPDPGIRQALLIEPFCKVAIARAQYLGSNAVTKGSNSRDAAALLQQQTPSRNASACRQYEATDFLRCFRLAGQSASLTAEPDLRLKTCADFVEVFAATFSHFLLHTP